MSKPGEILDFWFGPLGDDGFPTEDRRQLWFSGGAETDRAIAARFGTDLEEAARGERDQWARSPRGRLALILLLDQFSRNVCRGTPRAFAQDARALALCEEGLRLGHDSALEPAERAFFYLPLEHSENLSHQEAAVHQYEELLRLFPRAAAKLRGFLEYARKHRELIRRFGRFPHRNPILGRRSTPAEASFLEESGERFGQG